MIRKCLAAMVLFGCGLTAANAEKLAMGLIVKMKDPEPASVVQLRATVKPKELPSRLRLRMAAAAARARVSYTAERPTAFAAQLIHNSRPTTWAEAHAEAMRLRQDPDVEWVAVNEIERPQAVLVPNDPRYSQQQWLGNSNGGAVPNIPAAWERITASGRTLSPVVVAVLDTGVLRHPDLQGRVLFDQGYDFVAEVDYAGDGNGLDPDASDPGDYLTVTEINNNRLLYASCGGPDSSSWHGTVIAGQLAAATDNNLGVAGMLTPLAGAPVLPVRVAGKCGASVVDIIEGMLWAAGVDYSGRPRVNQNPARVINLSFGGDPDCSCDRGASVLSGACLYLDAITALKQKGALLVAAAGNSDRIDVAGSARASRPASCPGVLGVTALNANGRKAHYANLVGSTGMASMGGDPLNGDQGIVSTSNRSGTTPFYVNGAIADDYGQVIGTSFSTPIAAGAAALMWAVNPGLTVDEVLAGMRAPYDATSGGGARAHVAGASSCSPSNTGSCACTTATCGAGVLDVDGAVLWALSQPVKAYVDTPVTTSFFSHAEFRSDGRSSSGSSGGGGATDPFTLALAGMLAVALAVRRALAARSGRAGHEALAAR